MAKSAFNDPRFDDEAAAFAYVESKLWPDGPICPHCGNADANRIHKLEGKATRLGLYNCKECKGQFTVRQGTIFRVVAPSIAFVASGHSPDVREQEGHFDSPNPALSLLQHENCFVSDSPYPGGYA